MIEQQERKKSILILNCCPLGSNEVQFWNSLFENYREQYCFHFFTTLVHKDLSADEVLQIAYEAVLFESMPDKLSADMSSAVQKVAQCDRIWEVYEENHSPKLAYSWLVFWTIALRLFSPSMVIIWNGNHIPESALAEVCNLEGVQAVFAERGPLAGTFALDKQGINGSSTFFSEYESLKEPRSGCRLSEFVAEYFAAGTSNWGQPARVSRDSLISKLGVPEHKAILFFPSQVDRDTNSKLFSPHFKNTNDALTSVVEWCNEHADDTFLLIKKHPMSELDQTITESGLQSGQVVEDVHIFDCIEYCDGIISINSSSAVEGALLGKPVLLLGNSLLNHWVPALKLTARAELSRMLDSLLEAIRSGSRFESHGFFEKLIFEYLCSANRKYINLGVSAPSLDIQSGIDIGRPKATAEILGQKFSSLDLVLPTPNSALVELRHHRAQLDSLNANLFVKVLKRIGLIRSGQPDQ